MTPLIRQDDPAAQEYARDCRQDTDPAVRLGTAPAGAGNKAAVTAASVPPLSGGPGSHGSAATHAFTIADSVGDDLCHDPETETAAQSQSNWRSPGHRSTCAPGLLRCATVRQPGRAIP